MVYNKQKWANGRAGSTPLSAARLDYMEDGIYRAHVLAAQGGGTGGGVGLARRDSTALIRALDMRDPAPKAMALFGDSTGDSTVEWFEKGTKEIAATCYPERPARLRGWNSTTDQPLAFYSLQAGGGASTPGGTATATIFSDAFDRTASDLAGTTPDVAGGSGKWAGTVANVLAPNGFRLLPGANAAAGLYLATMKARTGGDFNARAIFKLQTNEGVSRAYLFRILNVSTPNVYQIELRGTAANVWTATVVKTIGGVSTTLGTIPNAITSGQEASDYLVRLTLQGNTLTAIVGIGQVSYTLSDADVAPASTMVTVGFQMLAAPAPTFQIENLVVEGTVTTTGTSAPADVGMLTVYNCSQPGTRISSQYAASRLSRILPERPDMLVISHGLNYGLESAAVFLADVDAAVEAVEALYPGEPIPVMILSQNPAFSPRAANMVAAHFERQKAIKPAAADRGWIYVPTYEAFSAKSDGGRSLVAAADGIHPTTGPDSGTELQLAVYRAVWLSISERV